MIYVTSDIHGRSECLKKLLEHVSFYEKDENWLYILGDVIDRNNKGGVDILKWLLVQTNVQLILGNHEQMLLDNSWVFQEINDDSVAEIDEKHIEAFGLWEVNGGQCTMKALSQESPQTRRDILEYLEDCLLYDSVSVGDKNYILVHGGLGNYSPDKRMREYTAKEILWERPSLDAVYNPDEYVVILGHTPTEFYSEEYKNKMIKTHSWWNIDTGAGLDNGSPMLLCLDTQQEYYIENGIVVEKS